MGGNVNQQPVMHTSASDVVVALSQCTAPSGEFHRIRCEEMLLSLNKTNAVYRRSS